MTALDRWLVENRRTGMWLAGQVGVSNSAVSRWRAGTRCPGLWSAARVETVTDGKVTVAMLAEKCLPSAPGVRPRGGRGQARAAAPKINALMVRQAARALQELAERLLRAVEES